MSTLLYITAHPHDDRASYSMAVGKAFLDAYRENHPGDHIVTLDLYKAYIPQIDTDVFSGWGKLRSGSSFDQLSEEEKKKVTRFGELTDQFVAGDKYVFVTPMWNFSFPPLMKAYIDTICTAGKTFKYTENGPVGLLTGKKALHVYACGGVYSEGPGAGSDFGSPYLKRIMSFFGISSFETLYVEGMAQFPDRAEQIKQDAVKHAQEKARTF
ncbi:FMN-dependent NADH-azoreductase [Paenibacillus chitinolyticus]|uniref:FMN-dependent NADH-azoreductase n=1 Tax=Paenibacillus chitinolyticus TaxID=79263 RepID=UPI0036DA3109